MKSESEKVWDILVRIFHWTMVGAMIGLYLTGEVLKEAHFKLGYLVICLIVLRVIWGFIGSRHARFSDFLYSPREIADYLLGLMRGKPKPYLGHNPAGGAMIVLMLVCLSLTLFTGLKTLESEGRGPLAQLQIPTGRLAHADDLERGEDDEDRGHLKGSVENSREEFWEEVHEAMTNIMIALIVVHILGVIVSSRVHKENLLWAMITGKKKIDLEGR